MSKNVFPEITTVIQAEPWAEGHVARFITTRAVSSQTKPHRVKSMEGKTSGTLII